MSSHPIRAPFIEPVLLVNTIRNALWLEDGRINERSAFSIHRVLYIAGTNSMASKTGEGGQERADLTGTFEECLWQVQSIISTPTAPGDWSFRKPVHAKLFIQVLSLAQIKKKKKKHMCEPYWKPVRFTGGLGTLHILSWLWIESGAMEVRSLYGFFKKIQEAKWTYSSRFQYITSRRTNLLNDIWNIASLLIYTKAHLSPVKCAWTRSSALYICKRTLCICITAPVVGTYCRRKSEQKGGSKEH